MRPVNADYSSKDDAGHFEIHMDARMQSSSRYAGATFGHVGREYDYMRSMSLCLPILNKNSPGDEIANVNFYAVRPEGRLPEFAEVTQNNAITPFKVIQGHRFWYQSKAHIRFPISD